MSERIRITCLSVLLGSAAFACSGTTTDPVALTEPTRTHAIVSVEQQRSSPSDPDTDTAVMFGLLRVPLAVNSNRLLQLMGMGHDLPPAGTCEVIDGSSISVPTLSGYERVELLDVGDMTVTAKGKTQRLSRQAFPTVTDFISGVLYTTRDNPSDFAFAPELVIRARGSTSVPVFTVSARTIDLPQSITIDNSPISELSRLNGLSGFEVRWAKGRPGDLIWIELVPFTGKKTLSCTFADPQGTGVVLGMLLNTTGEGRLVFHRVSVQEVTVAAVDHAEVRFDVHFTQRVQLY